ncbi:virulence factor TspB C-terminal domain-related protein [Oceanimonas sp. GK1]|uniref:virulence factor TspB C-terminal domain-related protein n=1 Tax=Oceanimonas sp. (strain GK1 / IBRC-M 10197) TaxID=511062 RepID=UPI0003179E91|nr:virulence factor TspB C-terminal domain-related protein [Oceanimonas sp. GK1]
MAIRYFIMFLGLCFSNMALAAYKVDVVSNIYAKPADIQITYYSSVSLSSEQVANSIASSAGCSPMGYDSYYKSYKSYCGSGDNTKVRYTRVTVSYSNCIIYDDGASCKQPDEGCSDLDSTFTTTGSISSACLKMPSGSYCESQCASGICVDTGDGVHDHTLTGSSCSPTDTTNDICETNPVTGETKCFSSEYNPNPTNPAKPDSGISGPVDTSTGSGGGSISTGGGSTSGGSVSSPVDSSGATRDYTAALNQMIANQHEINNSVLSVVNNQLHSYNALLSIRAANQGIRDNTAESNQILSDILARLESMGSGSDGGNDGGDSGSDGSGSGGDSGSVSGAGSTYELLANADVPELPGQSSVLPEQVVDFSNFEQYIKTDYFGGGSGSCPPDYSITIPGFSDFTITYQPFCDFAVLVRPVIILLAWVAFILSLRNLRA